MEESEDSVKWRNRESATVFSKFRCRGEWRNRDQQALLWRQLEESVLAAMPAMPPHGVRVVKHKQELGGTSCDVAKGVCAGRGEGGRDDNLGERRWLQHTPGKLVATIMSANRVGESLHQPGTVGPKRLFGGVRWKPEM